MKIKKHPNIESATEEFDRNWNAVLMDASHRIQELLVVETQKVKEMIAEEILNMEEVITAKYGHPTAQQMITKALEVSSKFKEGLTNKRTKK